ncbi:MAG: hypothetical protein LRY55_12625 [Leadbetterella sp.]|nr:hypothetical protein [Leadbetterella sp.]
MIKALWKNKKTVTFQYLLSLLSALAVVIPFYRTLLLDTGHTLALDTLVKDFDFMVFTDALRAFSDVLRPYIFRVFLLLGIAALAVPFFSGGFIDAVIHNKFRFQRFLIHCRRFWGPTLGLALITGLFVLISTVLTVGISLLMTALFKEPDHRTAVLLHVPALLFFLLSQGFLFLLWDYSRVILVTTGKKDIFNALAAALRIVTRSSRPALLLAAVLLAGLAGLGLYLLLDKAIGMTSPLTITVMLLLQQGFIYYRLFLRMLHIKLASGQVNSVKTRARF